MVISVATEIIMVKTTKNVLQCIGWLGISPRFGSEYVLLLVDAILSYAGNEIN